MAIIQISKITNRKGLYENLPQLGGAEFGWAVDSQRLFIGNGTLTEGAPAIGNTEILTEESDITVLSNYDYRDIAVGYTAQTGTTASSPTIRTLQAKLDDHASVRDFGAVGDGVTDDTAAINRALYQLYCREATSQVRRTLFFPAGTYLISESLLIPTYASLLGEGLNHSIIYMATDATPSSVNAYVAKFADSLQQTGANIGSNSATAPTNIEISSMSFQSTEANDVFLIDRATKCWFNSVEFKGPVTLTQVTDSGSTALDTKQAVVFDSNASYPIEDITFDKCVFSNIKTGFGTSVLAKAVTVSNSKFETLELGAVLGGSATGFRFVHNAFNNVYSQGINFGAANLNVSAYNLFLNVGEAISSGNPQTSIVEWSNDNNLSLGDLFERTIAESATHPTVLASGADASTGQTALHLGRFTQENGKTFTLTDNTSNATIFTVDTTFTKAFTMAYTITRSTDVRHGTMRVVAGPDDSTNPVVYVDDYSENTNTGVTLFASQASDVITIKYTTNSNTFNGTLTYSISKLQ
jgi:hypothetical protein